MVVGDRHGAFLCDGQAAGMRVDRIGSVGLNLCPFSYVYIHELEQGCSGR